MKHMWWREEICARFLVQRLKDRDHLEVLGVDGRMILQWILKKQVGNGLTVFMWFRIGTGAGLL